MSTHHCGAQEATAHSVAGILRAEATPEHERVRTVTRPLPLPLFARTRHSHLGHSPPVWHQALALAAKPCKPRGIPRPSTARPLLPRPHSWRHAAWDSMRCGISVGRATGVKRTTCVRRNVWPPGGGHRQRSARRRWPHTYQVTEDSRRFSISCLIPMALMRCASCRESLVQTPLWSSSHGEGQPKDEVRYISGAFMMAAAAFTSSMDRRHCSNTSTTTPCQGGIRARPCWRFINFPGVGRGFYWKRFGWSFSLGHGVGHEVADNVITYGCGLPLFLELAGDSADAVSGEVFSRAWCGMTSLLITC